MPCISQYQEDNQAPEQVDYDGGGERFAVIPTSFPFVECLYERDDSMSWQRWNPQ